MYFQKVQPKKLIKITLKVAIPNDNFISYYYCNKKSGFVKFQEAALNLKYGTSLFKVSINRVDFLTRLCRGFFFLARLGNLPIFFLGC